MTDDSIASKKITLPDIPDKEEQTYDLDAILETLNREGQLTDYEDMKALHKQINSARLNLFHTIQAQTDADRDSAIAEQKYKRVWNRIYIGSSGTDKIRSTTADIKAEPYQNDMVAAQVKVRELGRRAQFLRDDLKVLESLSNDYRQIIRSQQ